MRIDVHHYLHDDPQTAAAMLELLSIAKGTEAAMSRISDEIQALADQAAQTTSGIEAVTTLVRGLLDQVEAAAGDEAALQQLVATGRANLAALAAVGQEGEAEAPEIVDPETPDEATDLGELEDGADDFAEDQAADTIAGSGA